jgi:hypothetical protein
VLAVIIAARLGRRLFGTQHELRARGATDAAGRGRAAPVGTLHESGASAESIASAGHARRPRFTRGSSALAGSAEEQEQRVAQPTSSRF